MPQRAKITQLPDEVRRKLDAELVKRGFSGYDALETWLEGIGISIGKSSIHRYGKNLERKLAAIKASTEAARLIAAEAPDDADQRSGAVISMIQTEVFEVLVALQELDDEDADPLKRAKLLSTLAKNVATLSRASVHQKRHEIEIRTRTEAAADHVARLAKKGGASAATVDSMKRAILRIATN
jgi:hypothetical protein